MAKFSIEKARQAAIKNNNILEKKVMSDPEIKALYERKYREIEIALLLREAREKSHLTQEEIAERMHTTKSAVSRLESSGAIRHSPSIDTLLKYANAIGYELKFKLVPIIQN
jgi:DNA-binding XRE family transcriptional regulator